MRRNREALAEVLEDGRVGDTRVGADAVMTRTFWSPRRTAPRPSLVADLAAWRARRASHEG